MPNGNGLSVREREDRIAKKDANTKIAQRKFKLSVVDVIGAASGVALGATLTRGMDVGPIPVKINTVAGIFGLYLLFTSKPNQKTWRKALTSFTLGMGSERIFDISEDRLGSVLEGWMNGNGG